MIPTVEMIEAGWKAGLGLNKLQVERILRAALAAVTAHAAHVEWQKMESAPKDGTMLRLLINPDRDEFTAFDDSLTPFETIGFNNLENTEEDRWEFAGWDWSQDCFITGRGEVIGWAEMPETGP